jgi:cation diffusion facilitator family transporter
MTASQSRDDIKAATRVTLIGAVLDLVLGIAKIIIGLASASFALVADGIHSLSDLVTDAFVLVMTRVSLAAPDSGHPYGHRRFETLGTIMLGIVLFAVAAVICFDSVRRLGQPDTLPVPGWTGMLVALVSIGSKEWIYRYTKRVADAQNSNLLLANAWHSRTDAFSSIAVLIGILGARLGFPVMDLLAAVVVALMIGKIAWQLLASSLSELVDAALPADRVSAIRQHALGMEGILGAHELRTRLHGGRIFVDLHVQVDDRISVSEGHYIADQLTTSLKQSFPDISDIVIHVDPEPDTGTDAPNLDLPLRMEVKKILHERWRDSLQEAALQRLELHYLEDQIDVDIYINLSLLNKELKDNLNNLVKDIPWLGKVNYYGTL